MLQSWLSSCLWRILFRGEGRVEHVDVNSRSTYRDVFRAVMAAHGGSDPPDDVIDAVFDCAQRWSTLARRRRRRRRSSRLVLGCRCPRRAGFLPRRLLGTSPGDRRTPHVEGVHDEQTRLHRRRSINNDDEPCANFGKILMLSPYALSPVHTSNNVEATLSNATSRTILSTKSNVASTLLLVWTRLYTIKRRIFESTDILATISRLRQLRTGTYIHTCIHIYIHVKRQKS